MLDLFPLPVPNCQRRTRREFLLRVGTLSGIGLSLDAYLRGRASYASAAEQSLATDQPTPKGEMNCILVWTRGGTSHHDTLDPKPNARAEVRGEFGVIPTALPGVQFSDRVPHFARHADKFAVVRNLNSIHGAHGMADAIMLSGWKVNPAIVYPTYGSVVARERGYRNNMPPFVQLGNEVDRLFAGGTSGYLGVAYNPFEIPGDPNGEEFRVRDLSPPGGVNLARVNLRREALTAIDTLQRGIERRPPALNAIDEHYRSAFNMITSPATQRAFNLEEEHAGVRDEYGRTNFGQSCLLARRLIEAGSRFVTVSNGGWDTHERNFSRLENLLPPVDQAFPTLIRDLEGRGLLQNTLVVWLTDFGRTPVVNPASGRDHWARAGIAVFAGAQTPPGNIIGETDAEGGESTGKEYYPHDIAATIYSKLGVPLETTHVIGDGRPMRLCEGHPIPELMG
ncbi:MAG: DUF1501 domain-containing protein [Planctomycetes bacterium]|nr:DUF1501 domain-containing protein [Planctomycetota bacterium]